ncbi:MAG TPA: DUF1097 domain-containing protein [Clostridium sp.]|uniref:DUF1097 domain-containing protein n=1 Tax=Clostridium sp. TaxID=1506 RepID=UPI002F9258B6
MNYLNSIGITIGILAGILVSLPASLNLISWVCIISWACYYASGAGVEGLKKTIASNVTGVLYGFLMVWGAGILGFTYALGVTVAIFAFCMCAQAHINILSFIPGAFCSAGAYFGAGAKPEILLAVATSLILGTVLGYVSDILGKSIMKKEKTIVSNKSSGSIS